MRNIFTILMILCFILLIGCEHSQQNEREKVGQDSPLKIQSYNTINKIDSNQKKDIKLQKIDNQKYSIKKCTDESEAIRTMGELYEEELNIEVEASSAQVLELK